MAVLLNLAAAILLEIGMYSIGRKDGYDAAWAEVRAAAGNAEDWQALAEELGDKLGEEVQDDGKA